MWVIVRIAEAVERHLADPGRIECEHPSHRFNTSQPAFSPNTTNAWLLERVVAAGIEDHDRNANPATLQVGNDVALTERCARKPHILPGLDIWHIHRKDVVPPADRHAVPGEEKESHIAGRKPSRQFLELVDQRLPAKV